jgi:putative ABC transport system ATP-binding protein
MSAVIELQDVRKTYALEGVEVQALRGVDLTVEAGEFVAITGPSGSGKSTLMHILGCLDLPDAGRYLLNGQDVNALNDDALAAARNRTIGFVFQGFNLLARTSAVENVETPLVYANVHAAERHRRSAELLNRVGLGERIHHLPNQLSGGQQQRVAIARALVNHPALILADEPTGNLDTTTSAEIMDLFDDLNRRDGITIVLITHEPEIAAHARRRLVMRDGRLEH